MKIHCQHARLHIGGEPQSLPPEVREHLTTCSECSRFLDETLAMEGRLRGALELPLHEFRESRRKPASMPRRYALAASVVLALLIGGGFWLAQPRPALAGAIVEHLEHEAHSWEERDPVAPAEVAAMLEEAGVVFDTHMPVTYAAPCFFRGQLVPHLVVRTGKGAVTVMLLTHESVSARQRFSESGYSGVLLPARHGSVAVIAREGEMPDALVEQVLSGLR